jgi:GNAT superfamily N-acetyltransferase
VTSNRADDPAQEKLFDAAELTWPAARLHRAGPWLIREGQGGGKRVSAASLLGEPHDIAQMEAAQTALGQPLLVMVRGGQDRLDRELEQAGYRRIDPVDLLVAPARDLLTDLPPDTGFTVDWPPLATQTEIWEEGGIGPARIAVMERCALPRTTLMGRVDDTPAATAFIARHEGIAMLHALEVRDRFRGAGLGRQMMQAAAGWAVAQGAEWIAVLVVEQNMAAQRLYQRLGMRPAGHYHYRIRE